MNNIRKIVMVNILLLIVIIGGGAGLFYFLNQNSTYIKTDNAKITGQLIVISAPSSGKLVGWTGDVGKTFKSDEKVGEIQIPPTGVDQPAKTIAVNFPQGATIVQQDVVVNSFIGAGIPLARAFDLNQLWVSANIEETKMNNLQIGQSVDVYLDAYPATVLTGTVVKIGLATASTFSLLPATNNTGNYTKVAQVIPVDISLNGYKGLSIVPGMNVSIRIHI